MEVEPYVRKYLYIGIVLLPLYMASYYALWGYIVKRWKQDNIFGIFLFPSLWVLLEFIRSVGYLGFPWMNLYYSQLNNYPVMSLSAIGGGYLISFLIVFLNVLLYNVLKKGTPKYIFTYVISIVVIVTAGLVQLKKLSNLNPAGFLKIAVMQPDILPRDVYDPKEWAETKRAFEKLNNSIKDSLKLIIFSESAIPSYYRFSSRARELIETISDKHSSYVLFGAQDYRRVNNKGHYFNTAFLVRGDSIYDTYDKQHLVPFGEWLPFANYLPFLSKIDVGEGNYSPGKSKLIHIGGKKFGVLICFESIFPEIARKFAKKGAEFLVVMTNDGWYGKSLGPKEHFEMSRFRAVETGRYVVRAAKTGISAVITPTGHIKRYIGLFKKGFFSFNLPILNYKTIYSRIGDIAVTISLLIVTAYLVYNNIINKKRRI